MGNSCIKIVFIKRYLSNEKSPDRPLLANRDASAENPQENICEALCDVIAGEEGNLSFSKGDKIEILLKQEFWWHGRNLATNEEGKFTPENVEFCDIRERLETIAEDEFPADEKEDIFEALCDVKATEGNNLSYIKGDRIKVFDKQEISWHGRNLRTREEGNFIAENVEPYDELKECPWYRGGMKRMRAEQLLLRMGTPGTFMIRLSETNPSDYSLSLRDDDSIKHYRIKRHEKGGYYIKNRCNFADLKILVDHYRRSADGLARKLENACPIPSSDSDASSNDQWETTRERIKVLKILGEGNFSEVYEGRWNETIKVAVKKLKTNDTETNAADRASFLAEATIMKKLSHPKLVRLYAVCSIGEPIYIILELMSKGNLRKYLQTKEGLKLSIKELTDISAQIADGMSFLEANNFIHRDLAARNILVTDKNTAKVADFGLSKILDSTEDFVIEGEHFKMAPKWAAPEVKSERKFSIKSDIWSFGIVIYEIGSRGQVPDDVNTVMKERPERFPELLYPIMIKCWNIDPAARPTFNHLKLELSGS